MIPRIGVFGGTFDPVHFGHLRPAIELCESLQLDTLRLLPCHLPAHRDQPGANTEQRVAMLKLAIRGVDQLIVDSREAERDTPSYSVDTLKTYRNEFPESQILFFMGMDAFAGLTRWYHWPELFDLAHLVVVDRPGARVAGTEQQLLAERGVSCASELTGLSGNILTQQVTQFDISATQVRSLAASDRNISFLVPESVRQYIIDQQLYR